MGLGWMMARTAVKRPLPTPGESPRARHRARTADNPAPPMKLLLVEDNAAMQRNVQSVARSTQLRNRVGPHDIERLDANVTLPLETPDGHR